MSTETPILTLSVAAAGAVVAARFITPAGAQAGADANTLGVARAPAAAAGEIIPVDVLGVAIVEAGAAVAANATVKADSSGRAITWVTSGAKIGLALDAAGAAGAMIRVLLIPNVA